MDKLPCTRWVRLFGHDAAETILKDVRFDYVYIDGDHSYDGAATDIADYWPLVREGGIMAGHDHTWEYPGVRLAVRDFAVKHPAFEFFAEGSDWWFVRDVV